MEIFSNNVDIALACETKASNSFPHIHLPTHIGQNSSFVKQMAPSVHVPQKVEENQRQDKICYKWDLALQRLPTDLQGADDFPFQNYVIVNE